MNEEKIYKVYWEKESLKDLKKHLDPQIAKELYNEVNAELAINPRYKGKRLTGNWKGYWSYRFGRSYRVIYQIIENEVIVIVAEVWHRKANYKKRWS